MEGKRGGGLKSEEEGKGKGGQNVGNVSSLGRIVELGIPNKRRQRRLLKGPRLRINNRKRKSFLKFLD